VFYIGIILDTYELFVSHGMIKYCYIKRIRKWVIT